MMCWSCENLQVFLCLTLSFVSSNAALSGYKGKRVNISCPYDAGFESNEKYLCKGSCKQDTDVLVKSTQATNGRYSTSDDKKNRTFTTTISDLTANDDGTYKCGVTRFGFDKYSSDVSLTVKEEQCCVETKKLNGIMGSPIMWSCPYPPQKQDYMKFLCKGNHYNNCTNLVVDENRLTLQDNVSSKYFMVEFKKLEENDAATYWCGFDSDWSAGNYRKIELSVDWCCAKTKNIRGTLGYPLTFPCPYSPQHQHSRKFICKGAQRRNCTDMLSQHRFSLQDGNSSSSFFVRVTKLEDSDAGTYLCGSDLKQTTGNYTKIELSLEWCCVKTETVSGIVGHPFVLSCPHPSQHLNNKKFLCKGEQRNNCTAVLLNQDKFILKEDKDSSSFLVNITKLEEGDAGTYWCGSDSNWSSGNYTKIKLSVGSKSVTFAFHIITALILALLFAMFIAYKGKGRRAGARKEKNRRKSESLKMVSVKPDNSFKKGRSHYTEALDIQEHVYENFKLTRNGKKIHSNC